MELAAVVLVLESVGAYFSHSLSLTVDAVHNAPDVFAFAVSWRALLGTELGTSGRYTFGTHRWEVFAGMLNATLILATGVVFGFEALLALARGTPFAGPIDAAWILFAALPTLGLRATNLVVLERLPARARDLNLVSVVLHVSADLGITLAVLGAAAVLLVRPGLVVADAIAALAIAALLVYESVPLFRDGWEVLAERTPRNLSIDAVRTAALSVPAVAEVHDVHVWAVCPTLVCMSAHVRVRNMSVRESMQVAADLRERMEAEFGILHSVFEIETGPS